MADGTRTRCLSYFPSALSPFPLSCHAQKMPSKGLQPSAPVASCFVRSVGAGGGEGGGLRESTAASYITFAGRPPGPLKVQAF